MERKIARLPEAVINQIAAGEVVENPASIVKELVENSLDAGAKRIEIEIEGGGQQLIRVVDDGSGMGREDALLCLERHATSKIGAVEDLEALATMGFRGEALAAIAAVSHFELKTASRGEATRVLAEGGRIGAVEPCARNQGTSVEVRSLFFNVPARKKFQKSASANSAGVTRIVEILSLAHPEIAFHLNVSGKKTVDVESGQSWKERVEAILGPHEHEISFERMGVRIAGFLAAPSLAKPTRTGQHLFVNRRPIFSPFLSRAVKGGYGTRISEHSHPPFVLFLEIPPDQVDINVHPQKKEARFRDEGKIYRYFEEAAASAFKTSFFSEPLHFTPPPLDFSFAEREESAPLTQSEAPSFAFGFSEKFLAVFGHYLLLEKEGLIGVDLRGAHARILYESLSREKGRAQALMWPLEIEVLEDAEEIAARLEEMGIECRLIGAKRIAIDALPSFLEPGDFPEFFAKWQEGKDLSAAASRFSRARKKIYSLEEATFIWRRLQQCSDSQYDPAGNRIWAEFSEEVFEQMIKKRDRGSS